MRTLVLTAVLLAPLLGSSAARAQAPGSDGATADKLFREGRNAADAGDYVTARDRFVESERLDPAPGTLLNIAECELHLGQLVHAREHFELAASGFPKGDSRRSLAAGRAAQIEKRVAHLTLRLPPDAPPGTVVTRNGVPVETSSLGQSVPADPGRVEIVVTAPGHVPATTTLTLAEGQAVEQPLVTGDPVSAPPPQPAPSPQDASPSSPPPATYPLRTVGFAVGGVGVAGLVVGSITGLMALDRASTMKSHCNTSTWACDPQGVDAASSGGTLATVSTVSFVAGAALVGVGSFLVFGWKTSPSTALLVPYVDPHGAGAAFSRSF